MSGLSLAVGPREGSPQGRAEQGTPSGLMGSVRTIELQLVAFIVVFSASGLVPLVDLIFPVFVTSYLYILSRFVFPSHQKEGARLEVFRGSRNFELYLMLGTAIGLFLPLAYVLGGFARGDQNAVKACTPHLFLLSAQILSEIVVSNLAIWSPPVRAFSAAIYTARRIFSLAEWVAVAHYSTTLPTDPIFIDLTWTWFGRGLAVANFVYFNVNMFCFIIPRFIPRAIQRYHEAKVASTSATSSISGGATPATVPPKEVAARKNLPPKEVPEKKAK